MQQAQPDSSGSAGAPKVKSRRGVDSTAVTIGHKGMPNIDTCGGGGGRQWRPRNMLGRLRAAAAALPLVLSNGNFYTANDLQPRAEAVVVVDGRITFVGTSPDALRRAPAGARRLDLHGATVLPGLSDAHAHLGDIGERELSFNLEGTKSLAELQNKLRERAAAAAPAAWVAGGGWIETHWSPPVFPTRQDLDGAAAGHPVVLKRADGHALVANSLALRQAGIDRNTMDPPGGSIVRDRTGEPTGMLIDNAMERVERVVADPIRAGDGAGPGGWGAPECAARLDTTSDCRQHLARS